MSQTAFRAQRFCRGDVQKLSVVWETGLLEMGNDGSAKPRLTQQSYVQPGKAHQAGTGWGIQGTVPSRTRTINSQTQAKTVSSVTKDCTEMGSRPGSEGSRS